MTIPGTGLELLEPSSRSASVSGRRKDQIARWYLAWGGLLFGASLVLMVTSLISQSWIEDWKDTGPIEDRKTGVEGKDDTAWALVSLATVASAVGNAMLMSRFWGNGPAYLYDIAIVFAVCQAGLAFAAFYLYRDNNELDTANEHYGVGASSAGAAGYSAAIVVLFLLVHKFNNPDPLCHQLTQSQQHMVVATFGLFVYIQMGGLIYEAIEGWDFRTATQFALVTITTIGYGNVAPQTTEGRALLFLYCPIGFAWIGYSVKTIWSTLMFQFEKVIRKDLTLARTESLKVEERVKRRSAKLRAKIMINVAYLLVLIFVGAAVFSSEEYRLNSSGEEVRWTFFEGLYCAFITLSTVGYGDFSPVQTNIFFFTVFVLTGLGCLGVLITLLGQALITRIERRVIDSEEEIYGPAPIAAVPGAAESLKQAMDKLLDSAAGVVNNGVEDAERKEDGKDVVPPPGFDKERYDDFLESLTAFKKVMVAVKNNADRDREEASHVRASSGLIPGGDVEIPASKGGRDPDDQAEDSQ